MARISSYPFDTTVNDNDAWIGTESENRLTKQFTASAVANYLNINAKVNIGGQMSFKWSNTKNGGEGTISQQNGSGSGNTIQSLTTPNRVHLSIKEINGQNVVKFLEYITGKDVLLGQGDQISQFGHFKLDDYVVDPANNDYYIATLTYIGGNGVIAPQGTQYTLIQFNINDGTSETVVQEFNSMSNQWVINNTTGKTRPSVTTVNTQDDVIYGCVDYINDTEIHVNFDSQAQGKSYLN